jgi:hypothetical protein
MIIINAIYTNSEKTAILVNIKLPNVIGIVKYAAIEHGKAPLNKELWDRIVIKKEIPIEPFFEPKEEAEEENQEEATEREYKKVCDIVDSKISQQLSILCSPQCEIRGEYDTEFESKRRELIKDWYGVYKQEGYPFDVDYPETVPAKFYKKNINK